MEKLITPKEAGDLLGFSVAALRYWVRKKKIRAYRAGPRCHMRFKESELEELMTSGSPLFEARNPRKADPVE
jgi:excisionase family DNA binding protein